MFIFLLPAATEELARGCDITRTSVDAALCRWCASIAEIYWGPLPRRSATVVATNRKKNPEVLLFVNVASFTTKYDFRANNHRSPPLQLQQCGSVVRKHIKYCFKVRPGLSITSTEIILADLNGCAECYDCRRFSNDNRYAQ